LNKLIIRSQITKAGSFISGELVIPALGKNIKRDLNNGYNQISAGGLKVECSFDLVSDSDEVISWLVKGAAPDSI
jgi:hypothetical protein